MKETLNSSLTPEEKVILMRSTFRETSNSNILKNAGDYLSNNFGKIDGFDYRWNSLITSNPLLFEDTDYLRCKQFVSNTITENEIEAYKSGQLRELYATFENMLVCNLSYYNRIMSFCTMVFLNYIRLTDSEISNNNLENIPQLCELTPTKIWCCALSNTSSSEWELNYGWDIKDFKKIEGKSLLESNWNTLYQNPIFSKFIEYSALRCNTTGFRETLISDKTSNRKLAQVCAKFTKTSTAISEDQLNSIIDYIREQDAINKKLYTALTTSLKKIFNGDENQYAVYVFTEEFYIHTSKFSMKVSKDKLGKITKDYLANSFECFAAEEGLFETMRTQIEWAKYKLPLQFDYDKQILSSLLTQMLKDNYKDTLCIKRMNNFGILSKITFQGIFDKVHVIEELMFDNRCIKSSRICMSKENAAKYIIDKGYYIIGIEKDVYSFEEMNRKALIEYYSNYCIPVIQHMSTVISLHNFSKNDIIDVVCSGILNPGKLNNKNIKYTNIKSDINPKQIMSTMFNKQKSKIETNVKTYWKVIND